MTHARRLVDKLWAYANVLPDDDVGTIFRKAQNRKRFRVFRYDDLVARDKANLDTWIRDDSLEDLDSMPTPDGIAREIVEDLTAALAEFEGADAALETNASASGP